MEFGKHLNAGLWGIADRALPALYGVGYVFLVVRVLPEEEFGNFVLLQEIFLILSGLATAFALQPLVKYAAEEKGNQPSILSSASLYFTLFLAAGTMIVVLAREPLSLVFGSPKFSGILIYLPALVLSSLPRILTLAILQARLRIREIFWVNSVYFLGAPLLFWLGLHVLHLETAVGLILFMAAAQTGSSLLGLYFARSDLRFTTTPLRSDLRRTWEYGKFTLGASLSGMTAAKADTFILAAYGGPGQVALYNSVKVFVRAYDMITQVVQLFIVPASSRFSSRNDTKSLLALVEKSILFGTIAMIPLFIFFAGWPAPLLQLLYHGKYLEAAPVLRTLALPAFIIPLLAIAGTTLLGLGRVRPLFWITVQSVVVSLLGFFLFIPYWGAEGAACAYVASGYVIAVVSVYQLRKAVPITFAGVMNRHHDIWTFLRRQLSRTRR